MRHAELGPANSIYFHGTGGSLGKIYLKPPWKIQDMLLVRLHSHTKTQSSYILISVDNPAWETVSHDEVNYNVRNSYITDKYRPYLNSTQVTTRFLEPKFELVPKLNILVSIINNAYSQ